MKTKQWIQVVLLAAFLSVGVTLGSIQAVGDGGVSTKGQITLTGGSETTEPTSSSTSTSTTPSTTTPTTVRSYPSTELVSKPVGRYPSTGELVKTSLSIGGGALALATILLYLWKRKNGQAKGGKEG